MSEPNPVVVRQAILQVVDNQLQDNAPPETRRTLRRLVAANHSTEEAKRLIGAAVTSQVFEILKH